MYLQLEVSVPWVLTLSQSFLFQHIGTHCVVLGMVWRVVCTMAYYLNNSEKDDYKTCSKHKTLYNMLSLENTWIVILKVGSQR